MGRWWREGKERVKWTEEKGKNVQKEDQTSKDKGQGKEAQGEQSEKRNLLNEPGGMGIKGDHHYTAVHYWWEGKVIEKGEGRFIIIVGKKSVSGGGGEKRQYHSSQFLVL